MKNRQRNPMITALVGLSLFLAAGTASASILSTLTSVLGLSPPVASAPTPAAAPLGLLVPAYFDPGVDPDDWQQIAHAAAYVPVIAIMNPDNGPGASLDGNYLQAISWVDGAGGKIVGYVSTRYGKRSLLEVMQDVDAYYSRYPLDGIFVDEMPSTASLVNELYYELLAAYIRLHHPGALIVANPGTAFDQAFAQGNVADIYVDEEANAPEVNKTPQAAWTQTAPADAFAEIAIHSAGDAAEISTLSPRHIGWLYSTTRSEASDPYAALPADFDDEVGRVIDVNAAR